MHLPLQKLKALILYFCECTNPKYLGKTKLLKLFYFLDFGCVKKYGYPITYDQYYKLEHGPIPTVIKNMIDDLDSYEASSVTMLGDIISIKKDDKIHRIKPKRKLAENEMEIFSKKELDLIKMVCSKFKNSSTKEIEDVSHQGIWRYVEMGEKIPYELAAEEKDCEVPKSMIRLALDIHYGGCKAS